MGVGGGESGATSMVPDLEIQKKKNPREREKETYNEENCVKGSRSPQGHQPVDKGGLKGIREL